ncbi:MAG: PilZ domain-containing protein [Woeseiaceae bacterium]|nr:PilZ domain-containing protein [Woeseiaceae bacterium]
MNDEQENRRSFRISEPVYLKYEQLTDQEFHEGLDRRKLRLGLDNGASSMLVDLDARLSQAMYLLANESDNLGRCITLLNDKLNVVIDQLPGLKKAKASLAKLPPQTCDVGADGMVFGTDKPLSVGTKLYIQFLLESDSRYVETFCKVVRATDPPDADSGMSYGTAVEFHGMKPEQREILIQHMFNRESETLRLRRLQMEAMEP